MNTEVLHRAFSLISADTAIVQRHRHRQRRREGVRGD